ncbi:DUF935 domain-containing protein [Sphingomonas naphthae]|uniref:DUF935 domain-containing protein n=1 Tax=Sphingomonas naphthae TaxID=1813468 RepID=A0ABY7TGG8_9SPHN|nr:DUF935 domain-containing protein [Sphingomonas naphthae]WCT72066.1 DUF935 domain-containing protein [Sphingomonas naphthae]
MTNDLVPIGASRNLPMLVDPQGRPLRREELTVDIAGPTNMGVRSIQSGHPAQGLTPERLAGLLRSAEDGDAVAYLELAEEMEEKDLHYLGVLATRKRAVTQLPIVVDAAGDDDQAKGDAELVRDWLKRDMLQFELFDILDAIGKGFSVTEIIWQTTAKAWTPIRLETRDPRWFEFDRTNGRTLLLKTEAGPQPLSGGKYLEHVHPAKTGLPIRGGLARCVAWAYLFRNFGIKDWNRFNEAYGLPLRIGKYEAGTAEGDIRKLLRGLASLSSDFAAAFPKSMDVTFETGGSTNGTALFQALLVYFEQQISKAVTGQTASSDAVAGGLGSGQANAHSEVRADIRDADAALTSATINMQLVPLLVSFNRGPREVYPRVRIGRQDALDVQRLVASANTLASLGVQIGADQMRDLAGLPAPREGEEPLRPASSAAAGEGDAAAGAGKRPRSAVEPRNGPDPHSTAVPAFLSLLKSPKWANEGRTIGVMPPIEAEPDAIGLGADVALEDWEGLFAPVIAPIDQMIEDVDNLEELRDRLIEAFDGMDTAGIAEQLARAAFASRLAGDVETRMEN